MDNFTLNRFTVLLPWICFELSFPVFETFLWHVQIFGNMYGTKIMILYVQVLESMTLFSSRKSSLFSTYGKIVSTIIISRKELYLKWRNAVLSHLLVLPICLLHLGKEGRKAGSKQANPLPSWLISTFSNATPAKRPPFPARASFFSLREIN